MAEEPTMQERETAFKKYLHERVYGLVAVVDRPGPDEWFPQASGVVMDIQNCYVLVTVAHYLDEVIRWRDEGRLLQLSLLVHHETGFSSSIELDLKKVPPFPHESADVGFMLLPNDVVEKIAKYGGKATRKEQADLPSDSIQRYYIVGHAAAYCKVSKEVIASDLNWVLRFVANKERWVVFRVPASVARADGVAFRQANHHVWLADSIDPRFVQVYSSWICQTSEQICSTNEMP